MSWPRGGSSRTPTSSLAIPSRGRSTVRPCSCESSARSTTSSPARAASAGLLALLGGLAAVPAGVALFRQLFNLLSNLGGDDTPAALYDVFAPWELIAIPLAGVVVAVAAALVPGRWAARTNVAEVLH